MNLTIRNCNESRHFWSVVEQADKYRKRESLEDLGVPACSLCDCGRWQYWQAFNYFNLSNIVSRYEIKIVS